MINGKAYPCRQTMGAMLRFKEATGKEVTEIDGNSFSDMCAYLWCCIVSASKADGKPFEMSLMDFADSISPDDLSEWAQGLNEGEEQKGAKAAKKKKR